MSNTGLSLQNILGVSAFVTAGFGVYAATDSRWQVAAFCAAGAGVCMAGLYFVLKSRMQEDEENTSIWNAINDVQRDMNILRTSCVTHEDFSDAVRHLESDITEISRSVYDDAKGANDHFESEIKEIHHRMDSIESNVCETACGSKRK